MQYLESTKEQDLITGLLQFLEMTFHPSRVDKLYRTEQFKGIMSRYPKYGEVIFHDLVNLVAKELNLQIKEILEEFGNYWQNSKETEFHMKPDSYLDIST